MLEQRVLHARDRQPGGVAVHDRHEDEQRCRAHQERDDPFLETVQELEHAILPRFRTSSEHPMRGPACAGVHGLKPVSL